MVAGLCLAAEDRDGTILVHASAVASHGRALLFAAPPGGGKSTLATLLAEYELLSDEVVLVRGGTRGPLAFGTPVWSSCPRPPNAIKARLAGILFLVKSTENRLERLSEADAVAKFLPSVFAPPGVSAARMMQRSRRALRGAPAYTFHFRKDRSCVELLRPLLRG